MKHLKKLIEEKSFDYVNGDITDKLFPVPDMEEKVEYELVHFNKYISSEDAIIELSKDGWRPASLYDLLAWEDWNGKDLVASLGSVAKVPGDRPVPFLVGDDSERYLSLCWFDGDWGGGCRFLRVRNLDTRPLSTPELGRSDSLTLEKRIEDAIFLLKQNGYKITKEIKTIKEY